MPEEFRFADAFWFRVPLKALVVGLSVFALLSLYPALGYGSGTDQARAIFGFTVLATFVVLASIFAAAINDSHVAIDAAEITIRFEAFFSMRIPIADVTSVAVIDPRPRWRYRFGLSTDFAHRIACSHGGAMVELTLARPQAVRLWPRRLRITHVWLGVRDHEAFLAAIRDRLQARDATPPQALRRAA